jgi:hypothetical protein
MFSLACNASNIKKGMRHRWKIKTRHKADAWWNALPPTLLMTSRILSYLCAVTRLRTDTRNREPFNTLTTVTSLNVKLLHVLNATINIKNIFWIRWGNNQIWRIHTSVAVKVLTTDLAYCILVCYAKGRGFDHTQTYVCMNISVCIGAGCCLCIIMIMYAVWRGLCMRSSMVERSVRSASERES